MLRFDQYPLPELLLKALADMGFETPTVVQDKAMPIMISGKDLIAVSETGSGKTGAYLIPTIKFLMEDHDAKALILAPTRELAQQITEVVKQLTKHNRKLKHVLLVGGSDIRKQFNVLRNRPRIIVATPGRLIDHMKRGTVQLRDIKHLVLDEGDRMVDMGFAPQLREVAQGLPKDKQTCFFTATLDKKVLELSEHYLNKPEKIQMGRVNPVKTVKQAVKRVEMSLKDEAILDEINSREGSMIVFLKTKYKVDRLDTYLREFGVKSDKIHGDCTQGQRNKAIKKFREGKARILCATDVVARGLDIPKVEHVINYDLPMNDEDYVHRVGRTGRNGATGEALTLVMKDECIWWNRLVKKYSIPDCEVEVDKASKGKTKASFGGRRPKRSGSRSGGGGRRSFSDRSERGGRSERSGGRSERSERSFSDRSERGGRSERSGGRSERSERSFSDRSERGGRPERSGGRSERSERSFSDRSERGGRPERSGGRSERSERSFSDRSERSERGKRSGSFNERNKKKASFKSKRSSYNDDGPGGDSPKRSFKKSSKKFSKKFSGKSSGKKSYGKSAGSEKRR